MALYGPRSNKNIRHFTRVPYSYLHRTHTSGHVRQLTLSRALRCVAVVQYARATTRMWTRVQRRHCSRHANVDTRAAKRRGTTENSAAPGPGVRPLLARQSRNGARQNGDGTNVKIIHNTNNNTNNNTDTTNTNNTTNTTNTTNTMGTAPFVGPRAPTPKPPPNAVPIYHLRPSDSRNMCVYIYIYIYIHIIETCVCIYIYIYIVVASEAHVTLRAI